MCRRDFYLRDWVAENGGGGGKREMMPFVNGSTHQLQTQKNQDSQNYSDPLLFKQDVPISFWLPLAIFGEFI
jgi:hypothetical protein